MTQETIVRLKITSEVHEPDTISEILGLSCDRGWKIGDMRSKTTIREKINGWILGSGLEKTVPLDEQIEALLKRLEPLRENIASLLPDINIEVSCVIYSESTPALNFDRGTVASISALGASLDIDLYL